MVSLSFGPYPEESLSCPHHNNNGDSNGGGSDIAGVGPLQKANLQPALYGIPLPSGASGDPSSLSPMWDELFGSLKVLSPWQRAP